MDNSQSYTEIPGKNMISFVCMICMSNTMKNSTWVYHGKPLAQH